MEARLANSVGLNFDGFALDNFFFFFFGWERERFLRTSLLCCAAKCDVWWVMFVWSAPCLFAYLYFSFPVDISDVKCLRIICLYCFFFLNSKIMQKPSLVKLPNLVLRVLGFSSCYLVAGWVSWIPNLDLLIMDSHNVSQSLNISFIFITRIWL